MVDTSTSCGYSPTAWKLSTTSSNNAASVTRFETISNGGLFSAGPFSDSTYAGIYNVSVIEVTLNGVAYSTITNTVAFPNSFLLRK